MMLSNLLKEHSQKSSQRRVVQERRRQEACQAANQLTSALTDHLNVGVAQAYLNQKRLDAEAKQLHTHANNFAQQTASWLHLTDQFNNTLKELGDIETWAKAIESDMKVISTSLEYTYKVNKEATSGTLQS